MNPRVVLSLLVFLGGLIFATPAKATAPCMRPVSQDVTGTVVIFGTGCDLSAALVAFPQIDPKTQKPFAPQVQKRSIYAANQARVENGVNLPRSVLRHCIKPGRPDPNADAEELKTCPDGLMHYFAVAGAKVLIPVDRELTSAEKAEVQRIKDEEEKKAQEQREKEKSLDLVAIELSMHEVRSENVDLKEKTTRLQTRLDELEPQAAKRRWFIPLFLFGAVGIIFALGSVSNTLRLRKRFGRLEVLGRDYVDPLLALYDLRIRYMRLKLENDQRRRNAEVDAEERKQERQALEKRINDLKDVPDANRILAAATQQDIYGLNQQIQKLQRQLQDQLELSESLRQDLALLEGKCREVKEEKNQLEGIRSRQAVQLQRLTAQLEENERQAEAPEDRFASLAGELQTAKAEAGQYLQYVEQLMSLAPSQKRSKSSELHEQAQETLSLEERVRLAFDAISQGLCVAFTQVKMGGSTIPPPISDFVIAGTGAAQSRLEPDLQALQSQLSLAPSHLVMDCVKMCLREWAIRLRKEGAIAYQIYILPELHDLHAFLRSRISLGDDPDLQATVGEVDVARVFIAADYAFAAPAETPLSIMPQASG